MKKEIIDLGDTIIIDIEGKDPMIFNETATEIFHLLKENKTAEEIISFFFSKYRIADSERESAVISIENTMNEIKGILD